MAPEETIKVLISGGGIAGGCAAYWLSKSKLNFEVTVIERWPTKRVTGQAVDVRGHAIEIVEKMGFTEAIRSKNTTETGTAFIDKKGKILALFEADGDKSGTAEFEILRADLAQIFLDAVTDLPHVKFAYGTTIETLTQNKNTVAVTFKGGKAPEDYHIVIGADGLGSKTRSLAFDKSIVEDPYHSLGMYLAYFSIPSIPTDNKYWNWYSTPKGRTVHIRPHRNPETMGALLCVTMPTRTGTDPVLAKAMEQGNDEVKKVLKEYFKDAGWQTDRVVDGMMACDDFYSSKWDQVRIAEWTTGNVALIGDAASATPGAGTSYAIEGAYVLAGELSKIESIDDIPQALKNYDKIFRPGVKQTLPPGGLQLMNPQTPTGVWLLNNLVWGFHRIGFWKLLYGSFTPGAPGWELPEYEWR